MKFKVVLEEDEEMGGYVVECPALPGCVSEGDTIEEALENIKEAIKGCLEARNSMAKKSGKKVIEIVV